MLTDNNHYQKNKKVLEDFNATVDNLTKSEDVGNVWRKAYRQWKNWKTFLTVTDSDDAFEIKHAQEMLDAWEVVLERIENLDCAKEFKGEADPDHSGDNGYNRV